MQTDSSMGLRFTFSRADCFGTTESGWTEMPSHPAHAPLMVSGSRSTGTGRSFFSEQCLSPQKLSSSSALRYQDKVWMQYQQMAGIQDFFLIFFFKWSRTQMVTFLLSQSLKHEHRPVWAGKLKSIVHFRGADYCTDQFSLKQSHTWQYSPFSAFIWMGGFVLLVLTSPYFMPVSNILPVAQTSSVEIATVSNTHATPGKIFTVPFKKLPHLYSSTTSCKVLAAHS